MRTLLVWLLLATTCFGAEIIAPPEVNEHELVILKSRTEGASYAWFVTNNNNVAKVHIDSGDQSIAIFTGPPGQYVVMLVILTNENKFDQGFTYVTIKGRTPPSPNPPGPGPGPGPGPNPPPALDELGKLSFNLARSLPSAAKSNALAVVSAYRDTERKALSGELASIQTISAYLQTNRAAAMGDPASWSVWMEGLKPEWDKLWQQQPPPDKAAVLKFYKSTADGLEAAVSNTHFPSARTVGNTQ